MAIQQADVLSRGVRPQRSVRQRVSYLASRHVSGTAGLIVLVFMLLIALGADIIATHSPTALDPVNRLAKPGGDHLFGTDNFGRDLFSRTIHGTRISLLVGFGVSLLAMLGGTIVGLIAGYYTRLDSVLMRVMDAMMAFPGIILAIGIVAATGPSVVNVIIALGIVYIPRVARLVRSVVLSIRETQFIEAARSIGVPDHRIIAKHVLTNTWSPLIVQATFIFAEGVLGEATLSFLGVGAPPITPSWGNILGEARLFIREAPYMMILPGFALTLTVLSLNLVGDGIRDMLDPRLRRRL